MEELLNKLSELKNTFSNPDNEILKLAGDCCNECLDSVAFMINNLQAAIENCEKEIKSFAFDGSHHLESTAALANEFDASGDPFLKRQAEILDQALFVLSELDPDQKKYQERNFNDAYAWPREELKKSFRIAETRKAIENNKPKNYRPNEAALSTRHCPDHPGVPFLRIADYVYQCSLDHKIYDFKEGFSTLKGNTVPGGSVVNQWKDNDLHHAGQMGFETRESKTK